MAGRCPPIHLDKIDTESAVPRYLQAKSILADAIREGRFPPNSKLPNTGEISAQINVSLITAHKAIQCLVHEGWVRRERGRGTFVRNDFEAQVAAKPQFRVGLVLHPSNPLGDFYHGRLIAGIRRAAEQTEPVGELVIQRCNSLRDLDVLSADGLLCFHPDRHQFAMLEEASLRRPILVLGASLADTHLHCIDSENFNGMRAAVRHLVELGHRRIAIVNGPLDSTNCLHRYEGYVAEMQAHGLPIHERLVYNAELAKAAGAAMGRLTATLQGKERPTAIVAGGYHLALEALTLLQELRIAVPEAISLVGFDDTKSAALLNPPLTTVRQPLEEMGMRAFQHIVQLINGECPEPRMDLLPTWLIVRGSTARNR